MNRPAMYRFDKATGAIQHLALRDEYF